MICLDPYYVERLVDERLNELRRETEMRRMLREASIDQGYAIARQACRLLYRLGDIFISLGQRLGRFDASIERHCPANQCQSARL